MAAARDEELIKAEVDVSQLKVGEKVNEKNYS